MRILVAEDDAISRRLLEATLARWGYEVVVTSDGNDALGVLNGETPPPVAILDWMMPGMDGVEVCRRLRARPSAQPTYVILLTAKGQPDDVVAGLTAGADDYVTKPFDRAELQARVAAGVRVATLQQSLAERVRELEQALARVRTLQGLLPICSYCKRVRGDQDYWQQVETYVSERSDARFSHGICPSCYDSRVRPELEQMRRDQDRRSGPSGGP